jgi:hypothetical protein
MEVAERRQPLRASERPLRATGSGQEAASGEPGSIDPGAGEIRPSGSGEANRPALLFAVFNAVHAGSGLGWKSGHLEPFLFGGRSPVRPERTFQRDSYQLASCADPRLLKQLLEGRLDRAIGNAELGADFLVGEALEDAS